ncbi:hypothetical protein [Sulfurospirillum halorespirans]|uniref:Flagellar biosynthesis protein n=1 Tax=Sulfurospirillum halorespirans DSM 13726 TaxID=1193502 RepID=A0A1D7TNB2_9BACT|nr:hypothetical protein [Sulfurospirillum halorespirans]AOO66477.1 hypothetical protein SHALO_2719 [Sulfurospirillum halorespirans DSM 13726]
MKKIALRSFITLVFATSALLFSGCAAKRGEVALQVPTATAETAPSNGQQIYINSVVDKRVFEVKPPEPNIPSLDPSEPQTDAIKARAVARKRNGYGMAMGDIVLNANQTVNSVIKESLKEAFKNKGYHVIENKEQITPQTYIADVNILKFWAWMNPGAFAIALSCEIETNIKMKKEGDPKTYNVSVKAADSYQMGTESNYIEIMQKALQKYIAEAQTEIK